MAEVFKIKRTMGPDSKFHVTEVSGKRDRLGGR